MDSRKNRGMFRGPASRNAIIALFVGCALGVFLYAYVYNGHITGFFRISKTFFLSPFLDPSDILIFPYGGYDGQMFLSLAIDPLMSHEDTVRTLDNPRYRYRRILYPALGYLLGLGRPKLIPYAMVALNIAALTLLAYIATRYLEQYGDRASPALLMLGIPGIWITLSLSTAELLCGLALATAVYAYERRAGLATAVCIMSACLIREMMLVSWAALFVASILEHRRRVTLHLAWAWVPALAWNVYVLMKLPGQGTMGEQLLTVPFRGLAEKISQLLSERLSLLHIYDIFSFSLLMCITIYLLMENLRIKRRALFLLTLGHVAILSVSGIQILRYFDGYNRIFLNLYVLLLLSPPSLPKHTMLALSGLASAGYVIALALKPV